MNSELWNYVQKLKMGNLQLGDLNGCLSTNTNFLLEKIFEDNEKKRSIWAIDDTHFLKW